MAETVLASRLESKWAQRLDRVAVIAAIVVLLRVGFEEDLTWAVWASVGVVVVLLAIIHWPYGALFLLTAASAMPVFFVELLGWKARPEHVVAGIVGLTVGLWLLFYNKKSSARLEELDYWVLGYVAINFVSSAFASPVPSATLRWALQNGLAVLPYFLIRLTIQDLETLRKAFRILLGVGLVESAYGIFCYASNHLFGTSFGMSIGQYLSDVAAPYGSLYEPNLFGAYTGCCLLYTSRCV